MNPVMTDSQQIWPAPAKLNLMLHITGQRADGYHELQTVFQFLDFGDELKFELTQDGGIQRLRGADSVPAEEDLVVRAAQLLQQVSGCKQGVNIDVNKRLPVGAGLGGGSSDAATTLHALNRIWNLDLDKQELAEIALRLGADVPVFVNGFSAFAEGIGELLTPMQLEQPWYLVVTPQVHVSTAEIFRDLELTRDCPAIKICDLPRTGWDNVCVPVVTKHYPQVGEALEFLEQYCEAHMSGTGASVFAAFSSEEEAQAVRVKLPGGWASFIARGRNESPLLTFLDSL
jgi:4-diphosphocytidyl-2-C-methyl-D-erythritol kinase